MRKYLFPIVLLLGLSGSGKALAQPSLPPHPLLDLLGNRQDQNSLGHGNQLALYVEEPARFFYATHELGNVFDACSGQVTRWFPDHVYLRAEASNAPEVVEEKWMAVNEEDVVLVHWRFTNEGVHGQRLLRTVAGDCRQSADWRAEPGGEKQSYEHKRTLWLVDKGVFPNALPQGLVMGLKADQRPLATNFSAPGAYQQTYEVRLKPGQSKDMLLAFALGRSQEEVAQKLKRALKQRAPFAHNRTAWADFFTRQVPTFSCSDPKLMELYAFRWYLLRFSTVGGNLGYFPHRCVLEGRQAYQTYCCFSAPFMGLDLNWASDPGRGFGQVANMLEATLEDGRFPWYTSPRTNRVPLHHDSRTGLSLLAYATWRWYELHGKQEQLAALYPQLAHNLRWWIQDRDPDGNGLFEIDHQLETGMDDLYRWGKAQADMRYEALDASSYAYANLLALANMAEVLGHPEDQAFFVAYAEKTAAAMHRLLWDEDRQAWFDLHPHSQHLADAYPTITMFYPFFVGAADAAHMGVFRNFLLNPREFWTNHPVPAVPLSHPQYDPASFWTGPAWPAATSHVIEAFGTAARTYDRSLLPKAGELFRRAAYNHLQARANFYERYHPETGKGLSSFKDYMHSWWIDLYARQLMGIRFEEGSLLVDPLPMELSHASMTNIPYRGHRLAVHWRAPEAAEEDKPSGLQVWLDGSLLYEDAAFQAGAVPARIALP